jgi:peroxiredoxin
MTGAETSASDAPTAERMATPESPAPARSGVLRGRGRWIVGIVVLAVALPVGWYFGTKPLVAPSTSGQTLMGQPAKGVGPLVGFEAPNFKLQDPTGKPVELKQFRGKSVLINFWATWCVPCRDEMPELEQLYREHADQGLVVLAVSIDNESSTKFIPEYLKEGSPLTGAYTFPVALDSQQDVMKSYKLTGVPSSYFVDPAGVIRAVQPGAMSRRTLDERVAAIFPIPDSK